MQGLLQTLVVCLAVSSASVSTLYVYSGRASAESTGHGQEGAAGGRVLLGAPANIKQQAAQHPASKETSYVWTDWIAAMSSPTPVIVYRTLPYTTKGGSGAVHYTATFDGRQSRAPWGRQVQDWHWQIQGKDVNGKPVSLSRDGPVVSLTLPAGAYSVTLEVKDGTGATAKETAKLLVNNAAVAAPVSQAPQNKATQQVQSAGEQYRARHRAKSQQQLTLPPKALDADAASKPTVAEPPGGGKRAVVPPISSPPTASPPPPPPPMPATAVPSEGHQQDDDPTDTRQPKGDSSSIEEESSSDTVTVEQLTPMDPAADEPADTSDDVTVTPVPLASPPPLSPPPPPPPPPPPKRAPRPPVANDYDEYAPDPPLPPAPGGTTAASTAISD